MNGSEPTLTPEERQEERRQALIVLAYFLSHFTQDEMTEYILACRAIVAGNRSRDLPARWKAAWDKANRLGAPGVMANLIRWMSPEELKQAELAASSVVWRNSNL